jgi:carbon-monoxide dehydrogenase small subunit
MTMISLSVNDEKHVRDIAEHLLLVDFLREDLNLRGTRVSCDQGACGACTVLVDGAVCTACMTFVFAVDGCDIRTVESLAGADGSLNALQEAFNCFGVPQCGFCTSGMLMLAEGLRRHTEQEFDATEWMSANICRCSGYLGIVRALASLPKGSDYEK